MINPDSGYLRGYIRYLCKSKYTVLVDDIGTERVEYDCCQEG